MNIAKALAQVMDLPVSLAIQEAQNKLHETTVLINGELHFIYDVTSKYIACVNKPLSESFCLEEVDSLEVWIPETGVYFTKDTATPVFFQRKPNRQWKKSFSPTFYNITSLNGNDYSVLKIDPNSRKTIWVDSNKVIWYFNTKIGYIKDSSSLVCTSSIFEQELKDWSREIYG